MAEKSDYALAPLAGPAIDTAQQLASASFKNPMICSSENRFFTSVSFLENGLYKDQLGTKIGEQVRTDSLTL